LVVIVLLTEEVEIYDEVDTSVESGPEDEPQNELKEAVDD